jgi:hypothetical protein
VPEKLLQTIAELEPALYGQVLNTLLGHKWQAYAEAYVVLVLGLKTALQTCSVIDGPTSHSRDFAVLLIARGLDTAFCTLCLVAPSI